MKKNKSILLGILIIVVVVFIAGCGFYNVVDKTEFKEHFGALGWTVTDTEQGKYESSSYSVATKSDMPFKIEHYEFENEVEAKKAYEKYKKAISEYITSDSKNKETTGAVFSKVVAISDKEYIIISRVKETLIFVAGTNEYAKQIDTLLEDIKY